jgi:hypothetical protein
MDAKVRDALDYLAGFNHLTEVTVTLRAHIEGLEADAARYRWLRQYDVDSYLANGKLERLDAAIDAAMRGGES